MFRPHISAAPSIRLAKRRSVILIVVLAMLALFAVIGIAFVFYSDNEATSSRIHREVMTDTSVPPLDPFAIDTVNSFFGQFLFDVSDTNASPHQNDPLSALRGHSLAATLYTMIAGKPPFQGETVEEVVEKIRLDEPPRFASLNLSVPENVERLLRRCLAKRPQDRPASAEELRKELEKIAQANNIPL